MIYDCASCGFDVPRRQRVTVHDDEACTYCDGPVTERAYKENPMSNDTTAYSTGPLPRVETAPDPAVEAIVEEIASVNRSTTAMRRRIRRAVEAGMALAREACAVIVDSEATKYESVARRYQKDDLETSRWYGRAAKRLREIADAIRARGTR